MPWFKRFGKPSKSNLKDTDTVEGGLPQLSANKVDTKGKRRANTMAVAERDLDVSSPWFASRALDAH
jgi:hypothetical protein